MASDKMEKVDRMHRDAAWPPGDTLPAFSGTDKTFTASRWVTEIEENAEIFGWSPTQQLILARRSLTGNALLWLRSEKTFKTFEELKSAILKEFPEVLNAKEIHEILTKRKKGREESCYEYMLVMKELGKRGKLADYVVIQYIIDGIVDCELNKVMLYGTTSYASLKDKLLIYENIKKKMHVKEKKPIATKEHQNNGRFKRCYNCGEGGHIATSCSKGVKCFKCNEYGHIAPNCRNEFNGKNNGEWTAPARAAPRQAMCVTATNTAADHDPEVDNNGVGDHRYSNQSDSCQTVMNVNKTLKANNSLKMLEINGVNIESLIDSGSEVNLVSSELLLELNVSSYVKEKIALNGLGPSKVYSVGKFETVLKIDDYCFELMFYIVPGNAMPYRLILGQPFLEEAVVMFDKGMVSVVSRNVSCLFTDVNPVSYVPDSQIMKEAQKLVMEYKPLQIKEAPFEMQIILKDDIPVAQRPRRLAYKEQEAVDNQIGEWLQRGIIQPSFSEYSSPIVLVKKKDGSNRVCIDYRGINAKMMKDEFPLPIIEDHIDKLLHAKVFSKLDLKDAFFHLIIKKECRKYTSFVTQSGQYEFTRAPFGLSICPNYFTRYITFIFRELIEENIMMIFIDDVILPSKNHDEGIERLKRVLKVAANYGLQINWKKSEVLTTKVEYLGYIIENETVKPSTDKTDAVMKFPQPRNIKQLQSFIGLTSYFRKFIEGYAQIARPLTELLKKDKDFVFGKEETNAFNILKSNLSQAPVLRIFNPALETELHTDASQQAYSAVLMQREPNDKSMHPIYFMSKKTTDAQKKYTSYELEALAIIEGVKKFRKYLLGIPFKIVTDCLAFEMTLKKKDLTTRVARWVLLLQEYDYTVEHRKGSQMRHVDALSRNPYVGVVTRGLHELIKRAQEVDEGTKAISDIIKDRPPYKDYFEQNGLIYKGEQGQILIPKGLENEIIKRIHSNGHFGKRKLLEIINKDYYIKDLSTKIDNYLVTCIPCLLAMKKEGKQEGFLNAIDKGTVPLSTLHIDHIGPLSETKKLYNYILTIVDAFSKFVWLFPAKSTTSKETINKLLIHQQTFGNPDRILSDKGAAFTSKEFEDFCKDENIQHILITTGVPRGNGQVERIHRILVSVLTKLCIEDGGQWYKHVSRVQRSINSTYQRSIGTSPYELMVGVKMKQKEDLEILSLLQEESRHEFTTQRDEKREQAKIQILKVQEENRKSYNKRRKESIKYKIDEYVAIKRTQFGTSMKLKQKYLGPYKIVSCKGKDRYDVIKVDAAAEGPVRTSTSADYMKRWPENGD